MLLSYVLPNDDGNIVLTLTAKLIESEFHLYTCRIDAYKGFSNLHAVRQLLSGGTWNLCLYILMPSRMSISFIVLPVCSKKYARYLFHNPVINKPVFKILFKTFTKEIFKYILERMI